MKLRDLNVAGRNPAVCDQQNNVTDAGLRHLSGLANLELLNVQYRNVGDEGLKHLRGLTKLKDLDLDSTKVTDAGLEHLRGLTSLRVLGCSILG